jgi:hypothetical protein
MNNSEGDSRKGKRREPEMWLQVTAGPPVCRSADP